MFQKIAQSSWFNNFIISVILIAGILVGIETYPSIIKSFGNILHVLDKIILIIFILEIIIKVLAEGKKPWRYFYNSWNVFDFSIVAVCLLPVDTQFIAVLRLARILRVLRLITSLKKLRILVGALLKSLPSIGYVSVLLFLLFYIYAVMGTFLFGANDPVHFQNLQISMLSLFRIVTLEDWTDIMYIQMMGCDQYGYQDHFSLCTNPEAFPLLSPIFFVTFVLLGTMVFLNLFIGVIMNGMTEMQAEEEMLERAKHREEYGDITINDDIEKLLHELDDMKKHAELIHHRIKSQDVSL